MILGLVIIILLGIAVVEYWAPYFLLKPARVKSAVHAGDYSIRYEPFTVLTPDHIALKGLWIKSDLDITRGLLIMLHGIGGHKENYLWMAEKLAERGFESIVYDSRAHGESGGRYVTYGHHEKEDVSRIIDWIEKNLGRRLIGIWGHSLGGAVALQALEKDKRLAFGIIGSTFTDLSQIVFDYKKRMAGFGLRWLSNRILYRAGKIAGFDPNTIKPLETVKKITQPILLVHGAADNYISVQYGKSLYKALNSSKKELFIIKDGGHDDLFVKAGNEYEEQVLNFIEKQADSKKNSST